MLLLIINKDIQNSNGGEYYVETRMPQEPWINNFIYDKLTSLVLKPTK